MQPKAMLFHSLRVLLTVSAVVTSGAEGQEILRSWELPTMPKKIAVVPDLDGDGELALVVGNPFYDPPGGINESRGRVFAVSGRSGKSLWEHVGVAFAQGLGASVAAVGFNASRLGDINGDGLPDALLGRTVYYGGIFEQAYAIFAPRGFANTPLGDVDGDGVVDLALGLTIGGAHDPPPGEVRAYSGRDGAELWRFVGEQGGDWTGRSVVGLGDLNGDGIGDLVAGAQKHRNGAPDYTRGRLYFLDGAIGRVLAELAPPPTGFGFGSYLTAAGDLNGNGGDDFFALLGANDGSGGEPFSLILGIDGLTREILMELRDVRFGEIAGGVDWNGDDFPDFVMINQEGLPRKLDLRSGAPASVSVLGQPCSRIPGQRGPRIGASGSPWVGTDFRIYLSGVAPERDALLLVGELAGAVTFRFLGCPRLVTADATQHVRTTALSPGKGTATAVVPIPDDPSLVGTSFHAQWLVSDPGGGRGFVAATAVLRVEIQ